MEISRRGLLGVAMGVGAIGAVDLTASKAFAEQETGAGGSYAEGSTDEWKGTPEDIANLGGSTMPLAELNRRRQAYLDAQNDYTMADGTVIPAAYVKMRALINAYGMGAGNTPDDSSWTLLTHLYTEDDAEAFTQMPFGVEFTALDFHAKSGRPFEECQELCERFAADGMICRVERTNGVTYHQVPLFQGIAEYNLKRAVEAVSQGEELIATGIGGSDLAPGVYQNSGTPFFYAIPCDKSVVDGSSVLPFDDIEKILADRSRFAIAPCSCRYGLMLTMGMYDPPIEEFLAGEQEEAMSPLSGQRLETCLMMGDEAEYWVSMGVARDITREEALRYMRRSRDDGFILQSCFTKGTETICSCHADSCFIIAQWTALGGAKDVAAAKCFGQVSHYSLVFDDEACLKCGACAERCPLHAIEMDDDSGLPVVNEMCFRCGQCCYICPAEARKLVARPEAENLELPRDFLDDANMKAAYRFEHGLM